MSFVCLLYSVSVIFRLDLSQYTFSGRDAATDFSLFVQKHRHMMPKVKGLQAPAVSMLTLLAGIHHQTLTCQTNYQVRCRNSR